MWTRKARHLMSDEIRFILYLSKLNEKQDGGIFGGEYLNDYLPLLKVYGYRNDEEAIEELKEERSYVGKVGLLKQKKEILIDNQKI